MKILRLWQQSFFFCPYMWSIVDIPLPFTSLGHVLSVSSLCFLCEFLFPVSDALHVVSCGRTNCHFSLQLHPHTARGVWRLLVNKQPRPHPPVVHSTSLTGRAGERHTLMQIRDKLHLDYSASFSNHALTFSSAFTVCWADIVSH